MLKDYFENKRVIVVGPSPHLVGKNYGEFIDSFDLVVRINELGVISVFFCLCFGMFYIFLDFLFHLFAFY